MIDPPRALLDQILGLVLDAEEHAGQTDIDYLLELCERVVLDWRESADPRVVEGDVQPAEAIDAGHNHVGDVVFVGYVCGDRHCLRANLARGLGRAVGVAIGERHLCALLGETLGRRQSDA